MKNINMTGSASSWNWGLNNGSRRTGRDHMGKKSEVFVCINRSGYTSNKTLRWSLVFRFSPEAINKISPRSSYANAAKRDDLHRVYFREDRAGTGKKLSNSSAKGKNREMRFTIWDDEKKDFDKIVGSYLLCFDNDEHLYYIDWEHKLVADYES